MVTENKDFRLKDGLTVLQLSDKGMERNLMNCTGRKRGLTLAGPPHSSCHSCTGSFHSVPILQRKKLKSGDLGKVGGQQAAEKDSGTGVRERMGIKIMMTRVRTIRPQLSLPGQTHC